jgi:hypothetical protein
MDMRAAETALQTLNGRKIFDTEIKVNWAYQGQQNKEVRVLSPLLILFILPSVEADVGMRTNGLCRTPKATSTSSSETFPPRSTTRSSRRPSALSEPSLTLESCGTCLPVRLRPPLSLTFRASAVTGKKINGKLFWWMCRQEQGLRFPRFPRQDRRRAGHRHHERRVARFASHPSQLG